MDLESVIYSEVNRKEKNKCHILKHINISQSSSCKQASQTSGKASHSSLSQEHQQPSKSLQFSQDPHPLLPHPFSLSSSHSSNTLASPIFATPWAHIWAFALFPFFCESYLPPESMWLIPPLFLIFAPCVNALFTSLVAHLCLCSPTL